MFKKKRKTKNGGETHLHASKRKEKAAAVESKFYESKFLTWAGVDLSFEQLQIPKILIASVKVIKPQPLIRLARLVCNLEGSRIVYELGFIKFSEHIKFQPSAIYFASLLNKNWPYNLIQFKKKKKKNWHTHTHIENASLRCPTVKVTDIIMTYCYMIIITQILQKKWLLV